MRSRNEVDDEQKQTYEELKALALQIEAGYRNLNKLETLLRAETNLAFYAAADRKTVPKADVVKMDEYQFVRAEAERCADVVASTKNSLAITTKKLNEQIRRRNVVEERYRSLQKELDICDNNVVEFKR